MENDILTQLRRGIDGAEPVENGTTHDDLENILATNDVSAHVARKPELDLNSEDLFPALPPTTAAPKPTQAWRPAVSKITAVESGTKKLGTGKRVVESFEIPGSMQQKLPSTGKNSVADHAKAIALRTMTTIEVRSNGTTFVITGRPESVKTARKELVTAIGVVLTEVVMVPSSVRPHILGAGGKNLKDLTARTGTNINVPKAAKPEEGEEVDEDEEQPITIKGNFEGVREAKKEIEEIKAKRTQNYSTRLNIDRAFHPFIAGANNSTVEGIEEKTGTRIHIPPLVAPSAEKKEGVPEKNVNEIVIVGPRDSVKAAEEQIRSLYEELQRTTRTLSFPIKKRQHRFIIGAKGKNLQEILEATGCSVELPAASDPSDVVTVRGPDTMLSVALQSVLQKSNQVSLEEIHLTRALPASTNPLLFLRYVFTKEINEIKKIETANNVSIHRMLDNPSDPIIEIQGKTKLEAEAARIQLNQLVQEWGATLFFGEVEIPHGLHKFVVGKGGANIVKMKAQPVWEGRLADVVVPSESEGSDEILVVVRRLPRGLGGAPNAKAATKKPAGAAKAETEDDEEVAAFAEKVRAEILSVSLAFADFTSEVVPVPGKFHGRLIGAGGKDLKELLSAYNEEVSIRFPTATGKEDKKKDDKKVDADTVVIKGPKKLVADCKAKLAKVLVELKRIETLGSYTETLKVKKGTGKKLREGAGAPVSSGSNIVQEHGRGETIGWLIRLIKENLIANPPKAADAVTAENHHMLSLLKVEVTESAKDADDVITFTGPKDIVAIAKKIISDRSVRLANQVTVEFKVFQICSKASKEVLEENLIPDLKNRVMRKLIGREGKSVKALMDKYAVAVQFPEGGKKRKVKVEDESEEAVEEEADDEEASNAVVDGLVIVKGNPKDVEAAKTEIMKIAESEILNSYITSFEVPRSVLPHVLGASGSKIKSLRETHNVRIDLKDVENDEGEISVLISLEGTKADCLSVQDKILNVTDELVNVETRALSVPSYLHKDIIGVSGTRIKAVIDTFGGPDKVKVQFPPRGDSAIGSADSNVVTCKAHVRQIDDLVVAVLNLVNEVLAGEGEDANESLTLIDETSDNVVVEEISIPKSDVSRVLGKGGDAVKVTMRKFGVVYWFSGSEDSETVEVKVVGPSENVDGVKKAIEDIKGKLRTSKKVALPAKVIENLGTSGSVHDAEAASIQDLIKKVRADTAGAASAEISNAALSGVTDAFITVRGDAKYVDIAVKSLEKGLVELTKYDVTVRVPVDADIRGHIIGKAGATISKIRTESDANVELARGNGRNSGDVVVIRGTIEAVEKATELVQKIIADQASRAAADAARRAERAAKEASSFSAGPARIDDDAADDGTEYVPNGSGTSYVPGFVPGQKPAKGKKPAVPVTVIASTSTYYASYAPEPVEESWKPVAPKKVAKKDDAAPVVGATTVAGDAAVVGAGPSKKKKKNKKSNAAAAGATATAADEEDVDVVAVPEPVAAPTPAPAPVRARSPSPAKVAPVARAASPVRTAPVGKPAPVAAPAPIPAPVVAPTPVPAPADDGWTVIPKKGGAAAAAGTEAEGGESGAAKKKKKKNKKKKSAAAAANGNDDEDEGDE